MRDDYYNDEDAKLTELGKYQAEEAGRKIKGFHVRFKAIFSSPYRRAVDTCKIVMERAELDDLSVIVDWRIGERRFDGLVGRLFTEDYNRMLYDYNSRQSALDGVESLESLEQRAREFIDDIIERYHEGDFLIISHSAFELAFRAVVEGRPPGGNLYEWDLIGNGEIKIYVV